MPLFDATFVPPPTLTGLTVSAENPAAVALDWDTSTLSPADFRGYRIYRSTDGLVFALLATIADQATSYYLDYASPLGVAVTYRVVQVNLEGIESLPAQAIAQSGECDFWIVTPGDQSASFELPNAIADEALFPMQSTEHEPIGRPYKLVEQGELLGEESGITLYLLADQASTVDRLRTAAGVSGLLLKTPYGEVYPIALGAIRRSRRIEGRQEVQVRTVQVGAQV